MKTIKLDATGFEIEVPDNFHYHDDGEVECVAKHINHLYCMHDRAGYKDNLAPLATGASLSFYSKKYNSFTEALKNNEIIDFHICVLKDLGKIQTNQTSGHEESHLVLELKREDLIVRGLEIARIGTKGFGELCGQVKCDLGGIYAVLRNNGWDPNFSFKPYKHTKKALFDYLRKNTGWSLK